MQASDMIEIFSLVWNPGFKKVVANFHNLKTVRFIKRNLPVERPVEQLSIESGGSGFLKNFVGIKHTLLFQNLKVEGNRNLPDEKVWKTKP